MASIHNDSVCHVCQARAVTQLLDFGKQALCNRYLTNSQDDEVCFDFALCQCAACGLIQIARPVPPAELKPRFDWVRHNEQEDHLDQLVETICALQGVTVTSGIGAISLKDDTTLGRFREKGFAKTWRLDLEEDLGVLDSLAGLETIQSRLSPERGKVIARRKGLCDVVIVRHIFEHAHDPRRLAGALKQLVTPQGYLVFEVPDCQPALASKDFSMPWEEHIMYFTAETFRQSLQMLGFFEVHHQCYPYTNENSLVAIVRTQGPAPLVALSADAIDKQKSLGHTYAAALPLYREKVHLALAANRKVGGRTAVFGAGHVSCFWINALSTKDYIEFVIDDDSKKQGLYMPGSRLPIRSSSALLEANIKLCLLSLAPESESKVLRKNRLLLQRGAQFASIFTSSKYALSV